MIERSPPTLSVGAQCRLLSISRSSFYDAPLGETAMNQRLMQFIDRQFPETPFYGARQMTWHLGNEGQTANPKRVRRLMRLMVKGTVAPVGPRKPRNEYISHALLEWAEEQGIALAHIQPGQPQQNACVERYNRTVRHEWLDQYIIDTIEEAQDFATQWLWTYNNDRPNMGIGGITPAMKLRMAA